MIPKCSFYAEGQVLSREAHNRTLYVEWHDGTRERLKHADAEKLWHLPNGQRFGGMFVLSDDATSVCDVEHITLIESFDPGGCITILPPQE